MTPRRPQSPRELWWRWVISMASTSATAPLSHPRSFFSPNSPQFRLTDETSKLRLLAGTGLAGAVVMTFDKGRAGTTAQDFVHHDLIQRLGINGIAVGYDFHFGKGRVG